MKSIAIDKNACEEIAKYLSEVLSDTYLLYVKTQSFHWNLIDPRFYSLHVLFQKQYEELAEAIDTIAERIRTIGHKAPGSMREFLALSSLQEAGTDASGDEMLQLLHDDHVALADKQRSLVATIQGKGDEGTADLLIGRLQSHEKSAWFLRSHFNR